jgi:glutamate racemase
MAKIGVFDSGYGGLTILREIRKVLPQYDYLYLGDNARAPYGTHSFDVIYRYTLEAVKYLLDNDCALVILACNTASAKALRTIQQTYLVFRNTGIPESRKVNVLGVIRPTVEAVPAITKTGHVGILATPATVSSESYVLELEKLPSLQGGDGGRLIVTQQACPMWVPLIEAGEHQSDGAKYFVGKYLREILAKDPQIDTLVLGCTHYPFVAEQIKQVVGDVELFDGANGTARQTRHLLEEAGLLAQSSEPGGVRFVSSSQDAETLALYRRLFEA